MIFSTRGYKIGQNRLKILEIASSLIDFSLMRDLEMFLNGEVFRR